jgi:valyl-tRNA synthetase
MERKIRRNHSGTIEKIGLLLRLGQNKIHDGGQPFKSVIKVFVDLYNKGLIYRGYKVVNWDPEAKTNISDEEVIFKEQNGKLFYLKYKMKVQKIS